MPAYFTIENKGRIQQHIAGHQRPISGRRAGTNKTRLIEQNHLKRTGVQNMKKETLSSTVLWLRWDWRVLLRSNVCSE
jgi:hypothetical protein